MRGNALRAVVLALVAASFAGLPAVRAQQAGNLTADQIAERVRLRYARASTYRADFRHRVRSKHGHRSGSGTVVVRRPHVVSWCFTNGKRVVSDGVTLRVIDPQGVQTFVGQASGSKWEASLAFAIGRADLRLDYKLRKLTSRRLRHQGWVVAGRPRQRKAQARRLIAFVDRPSATVRRVILKLANNDRESFAYRNEKLGGRVEDHEVDPKVPCRRSRNRGQAR